MCAANESACIWRAWKRYAWCVASRPVAASTESTVLLPLRRLGEWDDVGAELPQRVQLDLADALARDAELGRDRVRRAGDAVAQPEPELDHLPAPLGQPRELGLEVDPRR